MKYIISAGGTGGHIYPALSIIDKIKEKDKKAEILYIGTTDRMEKDIVPNLGIDYVGIKMNGISKNIKMMLSFGKNALSGYKKCKTIMKKFKPDIVVGVGGYVTFPVIMAAHKYKIKTLLHEQNSIPGKANKFLSKYADTICISMESSKNYFPNDKTVLTGNPRGEDVYNTKKGRKATYGLSISKKLVLITMGSLGASTINKKVFDMIKRFSKKSYEVLLVTGKDNYDDINKDNIPNNVKVLPYIDHMGEVLKFTDLIITRAGATIISEITTLGIPSIIIPSPYVANNHQVINANFLKDKGASLVMLENEFDEDLLLKDIDDILNNNEKYKQMSKSSKEIGTSDSCTRIYEEIKKLIMGD